MKINGAAAQYLLFVISLRIEEDTEKSKLRSMLMLKILKKLTEL